MKECKEIVDALSVIGLVAARHLKDGFQASKDLPAIGAELFGDPLAAEAIKKGYEDAGKCVEEFKSSTLAEKLDLGIHVVKNVSKIVEKLKA